MKILYHHRTLGDGAEGIHILEMVTAFRSLGHEVVVVGPAGEASGTISIRGNVLWQFKKRLPRFFFEGLEVGYSLAGFLNIVCKAVTYRPDFIYDRYITFNFGTVLAAKLLGIPLYLEVNAPLALERSTELDENLFLRRVAFAIEKWVCTNSASTIVVSTPLKNYLVGQGVPQERLLVMPNGANPQRFTPRQKDEKLLRSLGASDGDVVIGFTGILRGWHGLDLLVSAIGDVAKNMNNVFCLIVGDGPIRDKLENEIIKAGLQGKYCITGRVKHEEVPQYVNLFDIAVSPKATFYASPMKVIEYMAIGKAVLVPNSPNFLDIIDPQINGKVFEVDSAKDLSFKLKELCDDQAERLKLGKYARHKVETRLNWQYNARTILNEVDTLLSHRHDVCQ